MSPRPYLASCVLLFLGACVYTPPAPPPPQQTIVAQAPANVPGVPGVPTGSTGKPSLTTTAANVTLTLGQERVMNDVLRDQSGQAPTSGILWLSSNDKVATINPLSGEAKAVAPGTAVLTASLQSAPSVQTQVTVTVTASGKTVQIRIEPANPELVIGERLQLVAKVQLADGTISSNVDWTSSDNTVAVVNPTTGEVSALKEGKVTVKGAYTQDGSQFGVSSVTVVKAATPAPTAAPTATPTPAPTATPTASATATPTPTPTATATPAG